MHLSTDFLISLLCNSIVLLLQLHGLKRRMLGVMLLLNNTADQHVRHYDAAEDGDVKKEYAFEVSSHLII